MWKDTARGRDQVLVVRSGKAQVSTISPSQISTWRLCHRKWGFTYLSGDPRPPSTKAQLIGTALHAKAEKVFVDGQPDYSFANPEQELASKLLPHILDYLPTSTRTFSEQKVSCTINGVTFGGRFDWLTPTDINDEWELGDLKTTSNLKWAKTELELSTDPQVLVYSQAQTVASPYKITCRWLYVQTRGAPLVREVRVRPNFTALDDLVLDGQAITVAWATRPKIEDLEPNTSACDAFGGCPFRSKCYIDPGERLIALQKRMGVPSIDPMAKQQTFEEMMAAANGIAEINPPQVPFTEAEALTKSEPPLPAVLDPKQFKGAAQLLADVAEKAKIDAQTKPKRTRRTTKEQLAADRAREALDQEEAATDAKEQAQGGTHAPEPDAIDTLYLDCMPLYDNEVEWADYIIATARAEISTKMGVEDYRLIDYKGAGILVSAVEEKIRHIRPTKLILDSRTPEGRLLSGVLSAMAKSVVRGL